MGRRKSVALVEKPLTRKQARFVRELVSCDGQITARQAAINAGYSSSSASSRAYEMMNPNISPHVCKEIEAYRAELDRVYEVGYKRHIRALGEIKQQALEAGAYSAAVMAEYRRGQAQGDIYVNRSEIKYGSIDQMDRSQVEAELEKLKNAGFREIIDVTPQETETEEGPQAAKHRGGALEIIEDGTGPDEKED
jgi:phage terminase small subunit